MAWQQWPNTAAPPALVPVVNAASNIIPPGVQYTPEQWAQAQQQNWQQWAQWQQQYQQWHQQYGAEYHKSLTALSQATVSPILPNMSVPPPTQHELKPPLPAEDAPLPNPALPALPPQLGQHNIPSTTPTFDVSKSNQLYKPDPHIQGVPPPNIPVQNQPLHKKIPDEIENNAPKHNNPNWHNTSRYGYASQSTSGDGYNTQKMAPPLPQGEKRPLSDIENQDSKRNKPEGPNNPGDINVALQITDGLSENEKKFIKQFTEWEAQFNAWKEQNINHPDKEQYREYKKKWEAWRTQLLERREQMRRKRLGIPETSTSTLAVAVAKQQQIKNDFKTVNIDNPEVFNPLKPPPISFPRDIVSQLPPVRQQFNKQSDFELTGTLKPPVFTMPPRTGKIPSNFLPKQLQGQVLRNTNELETGTILKSPPFSSPANKMDESSLPSNQMENKSDFLKLVPAVGIPGLDLVKEQTEDKKPELKDDSGVIELDKSPECKESVGGKNKPDLAALSKGINRILGDTKLLSMLSLVQQNQNVQPLPQKLPDTKLTSGVTDDAIMNVSNNESINCENQPASNYEACELKENMLNSGHVAAPQSRAPVGKEPLGFNNDGEFGNAHGNKDKVNTLQNDQGDYFQRDFDRHLNVERRPGNINNEHISRFDNFQDSGLHRNPENIQDSEFNRSNILKSRSNFPESGMKIVSDNRREQEQPERRNSEMPEYFRGPKNYVPLNNTRDNFGGGNLQGTSNSKNYHFDDIRSDFKDEDSFVDNYRRDVEPQHFREQGNMQYLDNFKRREWDDSLERSGNSEIGANQNIINSQWNRNKTSVFSDRRGMNYDLKYEQELIPDEYDKVRCQWERTDVQEGNMPLQKSVSVFPNETPSEKIWQPKVLKDYDHKPLVIKDDFDVMLDPFQVFDYRHKRVNRIPFPQRPKWLTYLLRNYPEFDFTIKQYEQQHISDRYLLDNKFEGKFSEGRCDDRYFEDRFREHRYSERRFDTSRDITRERDVRQQEERYMERRLSRSDDNDSKYFERHSERIDKMESRYSENRHGSDTDSRHSSSRYSDRRSDRFDDKYSKRDDRDETRHDFQKKFDDSRSSFERRSGERKDECDNDRKCGANPERKRDSTKFDDSEISNQNNPQIDVKKDRDMADNVRQIKNVTMIEDVLDPPGRYSRPQRLVIILRGPPGSGKTFIAKLIKDKEVENGGSAPRILSLDDYFMVEQEKEAVVDGKKTRVKEMVYEYEKSMEGVYRSSLFKAFKKTITDGYFSFIIVDNINDKVKYFGEMWSFAKQNGFQVYVCQLELDMHVCIKRNIHGRTEMEIEQLISGWEDTPSHHPMIDATSLIQAGSIPDVEMEEINSPSSMDIANDDTNEEQATRSKWDNFECSYDNLAKLDGINKPLRPSKTMEDYLQCDDDWISRESKPGKKSVRWADLEERKKQEKMRAIGFVVGQTNWDRMMDPTMGSGALTQTKYFERGSKFYND